MSLPLFDHKLNVVCKNSETLFISKNHGGFWITGKSVRGVERASSRYELEQMVTDLAKQNGGISKIFEPGSSQPVYSWLKRK